MYQAEFYDVLAGDQWASMGPALATLLREAPAGVAVDLGAGTGLSTHVVAETLPGAEVLACEPDPSLRACLLTRLQCLSLTDRVTALEWTAAELVAGLDEPVAVLTAINMLGHLDDRERVALWQWLSAHLVEGGIAIVGPFEEHAVTETWPQEVVYASAQIGRITYEGACRAVVDDAGGHWDMTWRRRHGDQMLEERRGSSPWEGLTVDGVEQEARAAGLCPERGGRDLLVVTKR